MMALVAHMERKAGSCNLGKGSGWGKRWGLGEGESKGGDIVSCACVYVCHSFIIIQADPPSRPLGCGLLGGGLTGLVWVLILFTYLVLFRIIYLSSCKSPVGSRLGYWISSSQRGLAILFPIISYFGSNSVLFLISCLYIYNYWD